MIGLTLRNQSALTNLLEELYNPASPNFRKFLTPDQFIERFGPTESDYQAVIAFAKSNHFVLTGTHPNRLLLDVNCASADIERALHTKLRLFQHPSEPRAFYSPVSEPSLDARLPILSIEGLDDFSPPRPMDLHFTRQVNRGGILPAQPHARGLESFQRESSALETQSSAAVNATGSGPSGAFIGLDFRAAYAPGVLLDGAGEAVGLVALDNYYPSDVTEYLDLAGLPHVPITNVLVNGFNRLPGSNNGEVALDIDMAVSMAPGLSKVIVYMGAVGNDVLNRMATDNAARQLSCSWTFGKQVDPVRDQILQQFAAQGQTMFQASGDSGAYGALFPPADNPFVTAVGGSTLVVDTPGGSWSSETAWFGSGGGISPNFPVPAWQKLLATATNQGSATSRNVPDVAAHADATIWSIANNGEQGTVGGTSEAAPLWAGFAALVNQQAAAAHQPQIGFLNPAIYAIGQGPAYSSAFHDITLGNNTNSASPSQFFAAPGYDLCTGWGTPNGSNLIAALLVPPDALQINPGTNQAVSGPAGGPFAPTLQAFSLTNAGLKSLTWAVGSTSTWLNFSASNGTLASNGSRTNVLVTFTSAVTGFVPGSYSSDIWFTNLNNGFNQTRRVTLNVVTPPVITVPPVDQTVPAGAPAQFVVQTASNAMLSFQWRAHGSNLVDNPRVSGSSTPTLTFDQVTANDNGSYSVVVTNAAGAVTSPAALLTVISSPPLIVVQPLAQTALPGADVSFTVSAYGNAPLTYRWLANGTNLFDGLNVSGTTSNMLTLHSVSAGDAKAYSVVVSNSFGFQTSSEAALTVVALTSSELVQDSLFSFNGDADGGHPTGLARGRNGIIYGTTQNGGVGGSGTIFQLDAAATPHLLHSFSGLDDGDQPNRGLSQASDGTLLGTTFGGGTNGFGTIFNLHTNGQSSTLFMFDHTDGVLPTAGLSKGNDGSLYGTASEGGVFHYGTIFRLGSSNEFSVLLAFNSSNGAFPHAGLTSGLDGNFYGTTYKGGAFGNGTIFKVSPSGFLTTLVSFNGTNGAFPVGELARDLDGSFRGTTTSGGAFGVGTIFRVTADGALTNLVSFTGSNDGSHPRAGLFQANDGNWYGTTSDGGSFGDGIVFRLTPDGAFTTISMFDGYNGANPEAPLIEDQSGNILGVAPNGGLYGQGVIYRLRIPSLLPQITGQPSSVVTYSGSMISLSVATLASAPIFYQWRSNGTNSIDRGNVSGSTSRVLTFTNVSAANAGTYSVTVSNAIGSVTSSQVSVQVLSSKPFITLQPADQTLIPGSIAVFKATASGNLPLTYQWQANGTNLIDSGNILGSSTDTLAITNVTEANNGTYTLAVANPLGLTTTVGAVLSVVPVSAPGTRLSTLHWFTGGADGRTPSELTDGRDGYLYGTTQFGGVSHNGTTFRISTNGELNTLAAFNQTNGSLPMAGLVRATNGLFYGTTSTGGSFGSGTVFAMTSDGVVTTVYDFADGGDGGTPTTTLIQGIDGNLYGSTSGAGAAGFGTIFNVNTAGNFSTLYTFGGGADPGPPSGALLQFGAGDFFGLTGSGGALDKGRVFRLTPGGALNSPYSFTGGIDGYEPVGALAQGDDGMLYGATRLATLRGFTFYGTLFKLNTNGVLNTLYLLNFTDGSYPAAGLVVGSDGNFYGTTEQGGANAAGTIFRLTPGGTFSTLVEFDGFNDGANPLTALAVGPDGALYGTTSKGGLAGFGTTFRLTFTGPPQITIQPLGNQTAIAGGTVGFSVAVTGGLPLSYQWLKNGTNLTDGPFVQGASSRVLKLNNLSMGDAGSYSVIVTNLSGSVASTTAQLTIQLALPAFQSVKQSQGNLILVWNTNPGFTYQLQSRPDLAPGPWTNLGAPMTATGPSLQTSVPIGPSSHQFYRVLMFP